MAKLISKTYGEALFELAVEEKKTDVFLEEVQAVLEALKKNPDLSKLLNHPKISKEEKTEVVENVFKGRISDEITGFLALIISKERYKELDAILEYFIRRIKEEKGIGTAYVTTAVTLNEIQRVQVEDRLLATTPYRKMEMFYSVDASLIGGMVIRIKDRVVDSSIKTKLSEIQKQLYRIQLGSAGN